MTGHLPGALRARNLLHLDLDDDEDDGAFVAVDHVYLAEGAAGPCQDCHRPAHDPGMVGLIVSDGQAFLTAEQALTLAHQITRAASLILESAEEPPDIEREAARFGAPAEPATFDPLRQAVWAAWNRLAGADPSPVKRIAGEMNMTPAAVAEIVYPHAMFGDWADDQEPDLNGGTSEGKQ